DGIRDRNVTGVQTCALPIYAGRGGGERPGETGGPLGRQGSGKDRNCPDGTAGRGGRGIYGILVCGLLSRRGPAVYHPGPSGRGGGSVHQLCQNFFGGLQWPLLRENC